MASTVLFVEKMKTEAGILGRDVLAKWTSVTLRPTPRSRLSGWMIGIEL